MRKKKEIVNANNNVCYVVADKNLLLGRYVKKKKKMNVKFSTATCSRREQNNNIDERVWPIVKSLDTTRPNPFSRGHRSQQFNPTATTVTADASDDDDVRPKGCSSAPTPHPVDGHVTLSFVRKTSASGSSERERDRGSDKDRT